MTSLSDTRYDQAVEKTVDLVDIVANVHVSKAFFQPRSTDGAPRVRLRPP